MARVSYGEAVMSQLINIPLRSLLRFDIVGLCVLATISLCVGLLLNQFRDNPLPLVYQSKEDRLIREVERIAGTSKQTPKVNDSVKTFLSEYIVLEDFLQFADEKRGIVLDARPEIFHRLGHVPGALSLPRDDFEKAYAGLQNTLEADKSQPIVIYCSNASCEDSSLVCKALRALGFTHISIFKEGWSAWNKAGHPEERNL